MEIIINKLSDLGEHHLIDGATEEQIGDFERNNSISFSQGIKDWLAFSDGGELFLPAGIQLYGVAHNPLIVIDEDDNLGSNYLCLGALSNGDSVIVQKNGEQVSIRNHESGEISPDETYEDFYSFLENLPELLGIDG